MTDQTKLRREADSAVSAHTGEESVTFCVVLRMMSSPTPSSPSQRTTVPPIGSRRMAGAWADHGGSAASRGIGEQFRRLQGLASEDEGVEASLGPRLPYRPQSPSDCNGPEIPAKLFEPRGFRAGSVWHPSAGGGDDRWVRLVKGTQETPRQPAMSARGPHQSVVRPRGEVTVGPRASGREKGKWAECPLQAQLGMFILFYFILFSPFLNSNSNLNLNSIFVTNLSPN
jgi:hypothetical protein